MADHKYDIYITADRDFRTTRPMVVGPDGQSVPGDAPNCSHCLGVPVADITTKACRTAFVAAWTTNVEHRSHKAISDCPMCGKPRGTKYGFFLNGEREYKDNCYYCQPSRVFSDYAYDVCADNDDWGPFQKMLAAAGIYVNFDEGFDIEELGAGYVWVKIEGHEHVKCHGKGDKGE